MASSLAVVVNRAFQKTSTLSSRVVSFKAKLVDITIRSDVDDIFSIMTISNILIIALDIVIAI